jgi:hypothetical protein
MIPNQILQAAPLIPPHIEHNIEILLLNAKAQAVSIHVQVGVFFDARKARL